MKVRKQNINNQTTIVQILLDKSGSMDYIRKSTIDSINEYIGGLQKDGNKYKFSLTFFDTELEKPYVDADIKNVTKLNDDSYIPNGMTALYDAVYQTASDVNERHGEEKVLFVIITDGQENSSHEHNQFAVANKIKALQEKGWTFVFMGANQDSWATATLMNIPTMNVSNYHATTKSINDTFNVLRGATVSFACSAAGGAAGGSSNFFNKEDQDKLQQQR